VDGRIHPDLIGIGTRTHRMSCAAPNLQQLPSGIADIRHAIVADPGNVIISVDYDTIEMRVLAACCGDTNLIEAVSSGDIHAATAAALFGDGFTPAQRSIAKTINFASIYGAGLQRLAAQAGTTPKEMAGHVTQWNKLYPGVRTWLNATADSADQGRVRNAWGRCYPVDPGMGYTGANYIIQSNARMIFAEGLLRIAGAGLGEHLLLPVHDEVLAQAMATTFQGVPITTTPKVGGRSWGSLYETGAGQ
jgi:DNA polymerase-1